MTEFNSNEPLWVGMDLEPELAYWAEMDRRRAEAETVTSSAGGSPRRPGVLGAFPTTFGKSAARRFPLTA